MQRKRPHWLYGIVVGAAVGAIIGAWTSASRPPDRTVSISGAVPPEVGGCPDGYVRSAGLDSRVQVEGTRARYLARCEPTQTQAALSESLELLWTDEIQLDPRARAESLTNFVHAVARSSHLLLGPPAAPASAIVGSVSGVSLDADGAYRLPPLAARMWILPAGANTLQVTLVGPRSRVDASETNVRVVLEQARGLSTWDGTTASARAWTVSVSCPAGYTDATPAEGGASRGAYVGRYCLEPGDDGGLELTFVELAAHVGDEEAVSRLFELASREFSATGVGTAGFGAREPLRVGAITAETARMDLDPPAAAIHVRAYALPAGSATVLAFAMSMNDHAQIVDETIRHWLSQDGHLAVYDPAVLKRYRVTLATKMILAPTLLTAVLGALVAWLIGKGVLRFRD